MYWSRVFELRQNSSAAIMASNYYLFYLCPATTDYQEVRQVVAKNEWCGGLCVLRKICSRVKYSRKAAQVAS